MASLRFFQDVTSAPRKAIDLTTEEDYWVKSAYMGGLVWTKPYEGIGIKLDFNEYYPHILADRGICWPIGLGEFKTITYISTDPIDYTLSYRIYRVIIKGQPAEQKCTKTFRYNPAGYYTHYDIQLVINLGLDIELSSENPNALIFRYLMYGSEFFYQ